MPDNGGAVIGLTTGHVDHLVGKLQRVWQVGAHIMIDPAAVVDREQQWRIAKAVDQLTGAPILGCGLHRAMANAAMQCPHA